MRLARLLLMALVVLIAGRTAAGQDTNPKQDHATRSDYVRPWVSNRGGGHFALHVGEDSRSVRTGVENVLADETCLTLHTLVVAREGGGDSTNIVAQRTCTPARQFATKSAVMKVSPQRK